MAAPLEFYFNNKTTAQNFTGDYSTYLTCTANRTGKSGSKNFFIIAHISTTVDNVDTRGKVRLQVDNVDYGEVADGLTHPDASPYGYTYNFVKRVSLDNSSHSITLDCGRVAGSNNFQAQNASIVVLEESANAEYAESTTEVGTGESQIWEDYLTLAFTPASTQNYVIIGSVETMTEDESWQNILGIQLKVDGDVVLTENHSELSSAANDSIYRTVGAACYKELASGAQRSIIFQMQGDGIDDEVYCRKGAIIAIPVADFENVYTDSQVTKTFHTGLDFSDTDVVMAAQSCNAADHLIIAAFEFSNENSAYAGYWRLRSDGLDLTAHQFDDRDEDSDEYYLSFAVHGKTLTAGDKDFEVEGNSSSDSVSYEGCGRNGYLIVAEIPAEAAPTYIPKVIMIN